MKRILIIILVLFLTNGCVLRKKQLRENRDLQALENVETMTTTVDSVKEVTQLAKRQKTNVTDKTVTTEKETEYSKPDSAGVQYKVIERIVEKRNDVTTHNELNEILLQVKDEQIHRIEEENKRMEYWMNEIIKLKEKSKPQTHWSWLALAFVLGAGTVIGIGLWLKRPKLL